MLQDLQWDGCRKETDYYEKSYGSRRNSNFRDTQVDIKDNSWSVEAGLRTCQDNSSSIRYGGKDISFIRKNGHILRGGERMQVKGLFLNYKKNRRLMQYFFKIREKPYSQVWKYKDDIRKMHKLQEQYLFLVRHKIESAEELVSVLDNLTDKKKEASKEKSKTYKAKERFKDIFDKAEQIRGLDDAESCYQSGDTFFEDEHNAWERLNTELLAQGYSVEEVESLRKKYESKYAQDCKAERAVSKELSLGRSIWKELTVSASAEEKQYDKETIRDRKEQPVR